ncbi:hypothetical protein [Microcoleus sp. herbarium5]
MQGLPSDRPSSILLHPRSSAVHLRLLKSAIALNPKSAIAHFNS